MISEDPNQAASELVSICKGWLRLDPADGQGWRLLAAALSSAGRAQDAEMACREAIARDGGNADGYKLLGNCLLLRRNFPEAAEAFARAVALDQGCTGAATGLAQLLVMRNDHDQAIALCRQAIARKPGVAKAHAVLGKLLAAQGRYAEAADSYRVAVELAPDFAFAQSELSKTLLKAGQLEAGAAAADRALTLRAWAEQAMPTDDIRQQQTDLAEAIDRFAAHAAETGTGNAAAAHLRLAKALTVSSRRLQALAQQSLAKAAALGAAEQAAQVATVAKVRAATNTNHDVLVTVAYYYLAKLLGTDKATAHALLEVLNLENFTRHLAVREPRPDAGMAAMIAQVEELLRQVVAGDVPAAMAALQAAAGILADLVERGDPKAAIEACRTALERVAAQVEWPSPLALNAAAAGMLWCEKKRRPEFTIQTKVLLHQATNGAANDVLGWIGASYHPPRRIDVPRSLLGVDQPQALAAAVADLHADGYHVFGKRLDPAMVDRVHAFCQRAHCWPTSANRHHYDNPTVIYDPNSTEFEAYHLHEQELLDNPDIQAILADPSFIAIATQYFGCEPVVSEYRMWWSLPSNKPPSTELAQLHHFDMDYLRFFKFWIYFTDVDADGGPHVYVRGSHITGSKPAELLNKGPYARITDEEIARHYAPEDVVTLTAPRGSIITGNTRCWHRGTRPRTHARLIFELLCTDSPVMGNERRGMLIRKTHDPRLRALAAAYPRAFSQWTVE